MGQSVTHMMGTTLTPHTTRHLAAFPKTCIAACGLALTAGLASADDFALKSNLLYDAALTPTISLEYAFAPRWSVDVSGQGNFWNLSHGRKWKQWAVQPEARFWTCQALDGHFFAAHAIGGQFNFGNIDLPFSFLGTDFQALKDHRHQGWMAGAGVAYGYSWAIAKHWNIEAEIGLGWVISRYDVFECASCDHKTETGKTHNYFGPTKAAVNIEYVF